MSNKKYNWIKERRKNPAGSGIKDRLGCEIFHGDIVRFVDKQEWYRSKWLPAKQIEKLPYEERKIELPLDYQWLLTYEIQTYWQVIEHRGKSVIPMQSLAITVK